MKPKVLRGIQVVLAMSVLVLGCAAWAQDADPGEVREVVLKDGRTIKGVVNRTDDALEIRTDANAVTTVKLADVKEIRAVASKRQTYLEKREAADAAKPAELLAVARWGWDNAKDELEVLRLVEDDLLAVLKQDPRNMRASLVLAQVKAQIKQLDTGGETEVKPDPGAGTDKTIRDEYLVSDRDILWIRLMEMDVKGKRVQIKFENKVLQRYIDTMKGSERDNWDSRRKEERFRKTAPMQQLDEILRNRPEDWDLLKDIHINSDPQFMREFSRTIWPMIQNNCAKTDCHGGPEPRGGLKFFVAPGRSERVLYTNYAIVSGFRKGGRRLVDRQDPDQSLLLQFGLEEQVSKRPHPGDVKINLFASKRDSRYRQMDSWIKSLRGPLHPNYHVEWKAPFKMNVDLSGKPDIDLGGGNNE